MNVMAKIGFDFLPAPQVKQMFESMVKCREDGISKVDFIVLASRISRLTDDFTKLVDDQNCRCQMAILKRDDYFLLFFGLPFELNFEHEGDCIEKVKRMQDEDDQNPPTLQGLTMETQMVIDQKITLSL